MMRNLINDALLSLLCGLALLAAARAGYGMLVTLLPDHALLAGTNPLLRLSLARLGLFAVIVAVLALPLTWPLGRHSTGRTLAVALPGAACATALYLLLEGMRPYHPFPLWLDVARAGVLFIALPLAARFWWRGGR